MRQKRSVRNKVLRGSVLALTFFSFIPAFALVRSQSVPGSAANDSQVSSQEDDRLLPGTRSTTPYTSPSSITPSQSSETARQQVLPRARTRAS
jgi:hypothetical protein